MIDSDIIIHSDDVIQHFGVKGMKWGKRLRDNHIKNLEYKYRKLGYNEDQVKSKLEKRLRNEKIALAVAGAAGGTAYKKHRDNKSVRENDEDYNKKYGKKVRK
jgi:hypothetical protein|uniref:Ribonuclease n=2 Tax=unclassified Caudoviricetes TaxID=2788787 RepID=A0A8S5LTT7_9CAUD|nr:MAG TPA: ribonuclease [Siphoviridae sp. ctKm44]DAE09941.1 MAG TPA: ribonuclease [Siphoviridae sp. ctJdE31]